MAEEQQRWQEMGGHRLCANNCGFFGCPTTLNLCSKCYKDYCIRERQMKEAKLAVEKSLSNSTPPPPPSPAAASSSSSSPQESLDLIKIASVQKQDHPGGDAISTSSNAVADVNNSNNATAPKRCATCRRRVGLTGFKCRCGITFCGTHRYPEQHGCTFDYKASGRDAIAKANPVVKADKLDRI